MKDNDFKNFEEELEKRLASTDWDRKISSTVIRRKKKQRIQYVAATIASFAMVVFITGIFLKGTSKPDEKSLYQHANTMEKTDVFYVEKDLPAKNDDAKYAEILDLADFSNTVNIEKELESEGELDDMIHDTLASR